MAPERSVAFFSDFVTAFNQICRVHDLEWQERDRLFNSKLLVLLLWQLVAGKDGCAVTLNAFWGQSYEFLDQLGQCLAVAASSFCEARRKLSSAVFFEINKLISEMADQALKPRWRGHRIFCVDGTKINLPKALKGWGFSRPSVTSYYPQGLVTCLFNLLTHTPHDFLFSKNHNEIHGAKRLLATLHVGDVIVYDRAFLSYSFLAVHLKQGLHAVFRTKGSNTLGIVSTFLAQKKTNDLLTELNCKGFGPVQVRLIRYYINGKPYCLLTTLTDKKRYPRQALKELYHARWGVEEFFKLSKNYLKLETFHSKTRCGVEQEIAAQFSLMNLAQTMALLASPNAQANRHHAINQLARNLPNLFFSSVQRLRTKVLPWILGIIARCTCPPRPGRSFPRRSRKPINRWQKNISKEWARKQRLEKASRSCA